MPGSIGSAMHIDPFANDQKVLVKGGEVVVLGWVDADGNYAEDEGSLAASSDSESEFDENDTASSTDSEDEAWLNDPTPAMDRGKDLKGKGLAHPPREKTTYYSHPYSTSLKQSNLFVSTRPDAAIVARLHKVDQPPVVAAAVDAAALNAIWAAGGTANQAQQQQGPAWSLDVIMVDLLHAQRDRQRRAELEQLVVDIRAQMHWEATHPRSADGKGKGKPGNVRTINEYRTPTEQREVDKPLWAPDEHIHGMKELWQREPEDDPDMMRDNGNETMLIAPTDPTLNPNRDGFVTLQAAETADEERGYLDLLQEAAGDLYEGKRAARVLLRIPLPGALLTWMRELRDGDMEDEATFHTEELGMPAPPPPRPGANEQPGTAGASNVATLANLQQQAPQPTPQQQRNNPAEMQHLLRNANFYLDPTGSGLAALTRRGGPDSARTVWIIDLGRNYEGRRGSVWDPFGLSDFVEGEEEDEFGREQNERLNTVQQLWGTSVATYVFEKPVRTFTWVGGGKFVAVTGERSCPPPGQAQPAESNVGGRTLNEDAGWERESARRQRFDRKDLLTSWHLIQVSRKEHPKPARSWELPGAAGPNGAAAAREIVPRTTLEVTEIGSSQRLHMPQLLMPDGVSQISEGGVARLDPANVSSDGEVFTNVLSAAQIRLIKVVLEPESLPQRPKRSLISNVSRGLWKLALSAADSYFGTTWVDDLDRDDDPERVKSMVRITRVVSPRGLGDSEAGCETIDIPGKYARFSPI